MKKLFLFALFAISSMISIFAQRVVVNHDHFLSIYDTQMNTPVLVEWLLTRSDLGTIKREPSWRFRNDIPIPGSLANHDDFTNTGFDRGHMCPAADRSKSRKAMRSTFVMSNIAPQVPRINRGFWKMTEDSCRKMVMIYDSIQVVSMPIFLHRDTTYIGTHRVAVPHAFIKVAYLPNNDSVISHWFVFNQ